MQLTLPNLESPSRSPTARSWICGSHGQGDSWTSYNLVKNGETGHFYPSATCGSMYLWPIDNLFSLMYKDTTERVAVTMGNMVHNNYYDPCVYLNYQQGSLPMRFIEILYILSPGSAMEKLRWLLQMYQPCLSVRIMPQSLGYTFIQCTIQDNYVH